MFSAPISRPHQINVHNCSLRVQVIVIYLKIRFFFFTDVRMFILFTFSHPPSSTDIMQYSNMIYRISVFLYHLKTVYAIVYHPLDVMGESSMLIDLQC